MKQHYFTALERTSDGNGIVVYESWEVFDYVAKLPTKEQQGELGAILLSMLTNDDNREAIKSLQGWSAIETSLYHYCGEGEFVDLWLEHILM